MSRARDRGIVICFSLFPCLSLTPYTAHFVSLLARDLCFQQSVIRRVVILPPSLRSLSTTHSAHFNSFPVHGSCFSTACCGDIAPDRRSAQGQRSASGRINACRPANAFSVCARSGRESPRREHTLAHHVRYVGKGKPCPEERKDKHRLRADQMF